MLFAMLLSAFSCHVFHVVVMGAEKEMIRTNAISHVAFVADKESIVDVFAMMQYPRVSVGGNAGTPIPKSSISVSGSVVPEPTGVRFNDSLPKARYHEQRLGREIAIATAIQAATSFNVPSRGNESRAALKTDSGNPCVFSSHEKLQRGNT